MGNEWHDGTPNSGGNGCGSCLSILTIIIALVIIAGVLLS